MILFLTILQPFSLASTFWYIIFHFEILILYRPLSRPDFGGLFWIFNSYLYIFTKVFWILVYKFFTLIYFTTSFLEIVLSLFCFIKSIFRDLTALR